MAGDVAEHAGKPEGAQIEILHHRIGHPVPAVGESERLSGDVRATGTHDVRDDVEGVEIAAHAPVHRPGGLPGRSPVDAALDLHADRIAGAQLADAAHPHLTLQDPLRLEEADDPMTDDRDALDVGGLESKAVGNGDRHAADVPLLRADDHPGRQEHRPARAGRTAAGLDRDECAAHRAVQYANGLQHERHQGDAALDALEGEMHQVVVDLDALDGETLGDGAASADDVELHAGEAVRNVADGELEPGVRVEDRPDEGERRCDGESDHQRAADEQRAAHVEKGEEQRQAAHGG